jgi:3-deoxy-D-manno-octulosonic acid (KDO) 8-phosphate synthase
MAAQYVDVSNSSVRQTDLVVAAANTSKSYGLKKKVMSQKA